MKESAEKLTKRKEASQQRDIIKGSVCYEGQNANTSALHNNGASFGLQYGLPFAFVGSFVLALPAGQMSPEGSK
jgi:hypothetical protein